MADNANTENQNSSNADSDNTDETNEDELLGDIPDEDEEGDGEGDKGKPPAKPDQNRRSEIIQKQKYRDKYLKTKAELDAIRNNPGTSKARDGEMPPADDKERQALEFIRKQAREEFKQLREEEKQQQAKDLSDFEDAVDEALEDNEGITETELLDVVEEYEVSPKVAASILKKFKEGGGTTAGKPKPKMPVSKRGTGAAPKTQPNDSKKSMYQVAQDIIRDLRNKGKE